MWLVYWSLAEEVWETFLACYTAQKNEKCQKAPELPLDLTLSNTEIDSVGSSRGSLGVLPSLLHITDKRKMPKDS